MRPVAVVWLVVLWVALWGDAALGTVLAGVLVGLAITALCRVWLPGPEPGPQPGRARRLHPGRLAVLAGVFLRDLVVSTVSVTRIVLRRAPAPQPAIVTLPLRSSDPVVAALVANGITLTPGTLTIDVDPDARSIEVHVLDLAQPTGADGAALAAEVAALETRAARAVGVELDGGSGGRP